MVGLSRHSGAHTFYIIDRVQTNGATLQLALAPPLIILLTIFRSSSPAQKLSSPASLPA